MKVQHASMRLCAALLAFVAACGGGGGGGSGGGDAGGGPDGGSQLLDGGCPGESVCGRQLFAGVERGDARAMLSDETATYLLTWTIDESSVWRIGDDGGELLGTVPDQIVNVRLLMDDDSLYVSGDRGVVRVGKAEPGALEVITGEPAGSVALDSTHVYWFVFDPPDIEPTIKRRAKTGGEVEIVAEGEEVGLQSEIAVLGEHIYWNEDVNLRRKPLAGGASELFGALDSHGAPGACVPCIGRMTAADGRLYWFTEGPDGTFFHRTAADAFEPELLVTRSRLSVSPEHPLVVLDDQLYWGPIGGGIEHAPVSGGEPVRVPTGGLAGVFVPSSAGLHVSSLTGIVRALELGGCPE